MSEDRYDNEMFAALPQGEDLKRYVEEGWPVHHFLTALLENDLMECVGRADERNFDALDAYCAWLRTYAPPVCFGSKEKVAAWISRKGLKGGGNS